MMDEQTAKLLSFFSAMSDANRLKIVGLLAQDDFSVEELAEMLEKRPSTVSHHLSKLSKVGLVSARAESYYNVYHLNTDMLEMMAKSILAQGTLPQVVADVNMDAYDCKVIENYSYPDGRLKTIPAQRKKLEAILKHIVKNFEANVKYSEKQVNEILSRFYDDTTSLRRELIAFKFMAREADGGVYWRNAP
ncbi:MAG TPA: metalloregulator ArsR/SmtB family transcription factor [Anaerolineales bacterium]|nr:metalloregulator ArsR/SmtB family transcription factor [Anaerolineales bacterium]